MKTERQKSTFTPPSADPLPDQDAMAICQSFFNSALLQRSSSPQNTAEQGKSTNRAKNISEAKNKAQEATGLREKQRKEEWLK